MSSSSRDFSFFSLFTAGLACLIPLANAYTKPVGAEPKGNPISQPGLNSVVPVSEPFSVTWQPTTQGTVTLVLLKGPSTNAIPQYAIAEKIDNNGTFVWTPSASLAPTSDATGYGIQLIVDSDGQYQYTTQFGISNPGYKAPSSSSSASSSSGWAAWESWTAGPTMSASASETQTANATSSASVHYTTEVVSKFTTYCPYATSFEVNNHTYTVSSATTLTITNCPCTITKPMSTSVAAATTSAVASSGYLPANSSIVHPSGSMTVPASLLTTASATSASSSAAGAASATGASASSVQTGAAAGMATSFAGLVVAAGVAVLAL